jgi:hypothetical protein
VRREQPRPENREIGDHQGGRQHLRDQCGVAPHADTQGAHTFARREHDINAIYQWLSCLASTELADRLAARGRLPGAA